MQHFFSKAWDKKQFLLLLFLFALTLRALVFHLNKTESTKLIFDTLQYHDIAMNLVENNGCSLSIIKQVPQGNGTLVEMHHGLPIVSQNQYNTEQFERTIESNFYRLPGYSLFLAVSYYLFGVNIENALWIQLILASFIPLLIFFLSLTLLPQSLIVAQLAAFISSIHVGFLLYASFPMTETLFLLFFLLFSIVFFSSFSLTSHHKNKLSLKQICIAGILLGIMSLVRAVGHYLLVISIILLLCSKFSLQEKVKAVGVLTGSWVFIVSWWLIRNFMLTGYLFFHTLPGLHFLQYSAVAVDMSVNKSDYFETRTKWLKTWNHAVIKEEEKELRTLNQYEICKLAEAIAFTYLKQHPWTTINHATKELLRTCFLPYSSLILALPAGTTYNSSTSIWQKLKPFLCGNLTHPFLAPLIYLEIILILFIMLGSIIFLFFANNFQELFFKLLLFIISLIGITLAYGCARLRLPIEPFLIIISVNAWVILWEKIKRLNCYGKTK